MADHQHNHTITRGKVRDRTHSNNYTRTEDSYINDQNTTSPHVFSPKILKNQDLQKFDP